MDAAAVRRRDRRQPVPGRPGRPLLPASVGCPDGDRPAVWHGHLARVFAVSCCFFCGTAEGGCATHGQDAHATVEMLWLGSKSTQRFLRELAPALAEVGRLRPNARLRVVGHEEFAAGPLNVDFRRWSPAEQELALGECDIGLCPMPDTPWTRGKCPYKVLQYMAAGMAWVGSAVGENLVSAGENRGQTPISQTKSVSVPDFPRGLCAASDEQWVQALTRLIDDAALRRSMGASGLVYVRRIHEREMLADRLAEILRGVVG